MDDQHPDRHDDPPGEDLADELLRRALLDPQDAAAVALKVRGLALCDELTVIFHGRRDLGTIQTYVANGGHGEGEKLGARDLLRVPVDLDLGEAYSREEAQDAYAAQARTLRDALQAADTVLAIWEGPLRDVAESGVMLGALGRSRHPAAGPSPDAGRAGRARAPPHDRPGLRRSHAR